MKEVSGFFKDKHGEWVIWQTPNVPLSLWFVATATAMIIKHGSTNKLMSSLAFGAIFTWAYLEISNGRSYFRRLLGVVVLVFSIYARVK